MQTVDQFKQQRSTAGWAQQRPETAFTLPSRYFFDEQIFAAERDRIFAQAPSLAELSPVPTKKCARCSPTLGRCA